MNKKIKRFLNSLVIGAMKSLPLSALSTFKMGSGKGNGVDSYTRWVFACVNLISNALARVDFRLYQSSKNGEVVEVQDHELLGLLYRFNNRMTKFDSLKLSIIYFLLEGSSPWVIVRNLKTKKPEALYVIPPSSLKVSAKDLDGNPTHYEYSMGQRKQTIPVGDLLIIKNPDPRDPTKGRSYIDAIRDTVETDDYMVKWNKALMLRGAKPSMAIEIEGTLNPEEQKLLKSMLEEQYAGYENAESVLILANGAKFSNTSIAPRDLEWIQGRGLNRDEIMSMFGVPKILLGLEGQYNRATAETAQAVFGQYALDPIMTMIVEQLNEFLVPAFGDNLWIDFESFAPADKEMQLKWLQAGWNSWLTTNEVRRELGKPDLSGGDAIYQPLMNVPTMTEAGEKSKIKNVGGVPCIALKAKVTSSTVPLQKQAQVKRAIFARSQRLNAYAKSVGDVFAQKVKEMGMAKGKVLRLKSAKATKSSKPDIEMTDDKKKELWQNYVELKNATAKEWEAKFKSIFKAQADEVIANLTAKKSSKKARSATALLFDEEEQVKATIRIIEPQYYATLVTGASTGVDLINQPKVNLQEIPAVREWVGKIAEKYSTDITKTTREGLLATLSSGIDDGDSVADLSERVQTYLEDVGSVRADMIARTESARALTAGEAFAWEQYDITDVEWYLAGSDPCATCQFNASQEWSTKEAQSGISEYSHPNCECTFLPK